MLTIELSDVYMSKYEAAERLGVHERTIRRLIDRGELAGDRVGQRCVLVLRASVERYARQHNNQR